MNAKRTRQYVELELARTWMVPTNATVQTVTKAEMESRAQVYFVDYLSIL